MLSSAANRIETVIDVLACLALNWYQSLSIIGNRTLWGQEDQKKNLDILQYPFDVVVDVVGRQDVKIGSYIST